MKSLWKKISPKKINASGFECILFALFLCIFGGILQPEARRAYADALPMRDLSADEIVEEMGTGWNLGNTLETDTTYRTQQRGEGKRNVTKELMKSVHDMGMNTVRIPVTWADFIDDEDDYTVDADRLSQVQDVVDLAISLDMYVIINVHGDGAEYTGWLSLTGNEKKDAKVKEKYAALWRQIATCFCDYDEHLLFEAMNEVKGGAEGDKDIKADMAKINALNQIFVDTVRETGANNATRWLCIPGRYAGIESVTQDEYGFALPADTATGKLFVAVHDYDWFFGVKEDEDVTQYTQEDAKILAERFSMLAERYTHKGIPVVLGEYGAINKNNSKQRSYYYEVVNRLCAAYGIVPVVWDDGWEEETDTQNKNPEASYHFSLIDRNTGEAIEKEITDAIMRGYFYKDPLHADGLAVEKNKEITPFSRITVAEDTLMLTVGELKELLDFDGENGEGDVVLWKSEDESIASVYNGVIHARGIGQTKITAFSQAAEAMAEMSVLVRADTESVPCTGIRLAKEMSQVSIKVGKNCKLQASVENTDTNPYITFHSSDEGVARISTTGKILGESAGRAYIVMTAATGITRVLPVVVEEKAQQKELHLALSVTYHNQKKNYYESEIGKTITVQKYGSYTLHFNCKKDLSEKAKAADIRFLKKVAAIRIVDADVLGGMEAVSPVGKCKICIKKILVNGKELKLKNNKKYNPLTEDGVFLSRGPLDVDGKVIVKGVKKKKGGFLKFKDIKKAKRIKIIFTVSKLKFRKNHTEDLNDNFVTDEENTPAVGGEENENDTQGTGAGWLRDSVLTADDTSHVLHDIGEKTSLVAQIDSAQIPGICFVSEDASVVAVSPKAVPNESGSAATDVVGTGAGSTSVTAYAPNGSSVSYELTVEELDVTPPGQETLQDEAETEPAADETEADAGEEKGSEKTQKTRTGISVPLGSVVVIVFIVLVVLLFIRRFAGKK